MLSRELRGLPQTKLRRGKLLVFKTPAIVQKKSQKPWEMEDVFDILAVPFIFIAYNFLIADQNLSGEEALYCNRSL